RLAPTSPLFPSTTLFRSGRTPRPMHAARVAYLKTFIEQMREAADVPGASVVLFDQGGVLIEGGFGVREHGRPEPVTADSHYIVADRKSTRLNSSHVSISY